MRGILSTSAHHHSLKNHLLIAMPSQAGGYFSETLTYLCEHNADGAMGLTLNRNSKRSLPDLLAALDITPDVPLSDAQPLLRGGPVAREQAFVLHSAERHYPQTLPLNAQLSLTAEPAVLTDIARGQGPAHYAIARGYAGWGAGQLEQELHEHAWFTLQPTAPLDLHQLLQQPAPQRLAYVASCYGIELRYLAGQIGHA